MFGAFIKEVTGSFSPRFVLTLFFPSLLFWAGLFIACTSSWHLAGLLSAWGGEPLAIQTLQAAAAVVWVAFFAYVLSTQSLWLTRQFEGYWDWPFGGRIRQWRTAYYLGVLQQLKAAGDAGYDRIYYAFPLPDEGDMVLPTRLGNILRNAELYPRHLYGMDAVLLWPRLYLLLPDSFTAGLAEAKTSLDLMLVMSSLSAAFAFLAGGGLLIRSGPWWLFLGCFGGGLMLAYVSYLSALAAAMPYAQLIKSAFDLHRGDLIDKLGYERPESIAQEIGFWENLSKQIYRLAPDDPNALRYRPREQPAPAKAASAETAPVQPAYE